MPLTLTDLDRPAPETTGVPIRLPLDHIDEDPGQPRTEFDPQALAELAQTIQARGVRQPVSVRPHPDEPGRWILNFGARRLRASQLAGETDIPAFVDESCDRYDQVIENEQREGLQPLELALFIERRLAAGESPADIARQLGKSRPYVTYACALIDAPPWLLQLYRDGRCRGVAELYQLRRLHDLAPQHVEVWIGEHAVITRALVQQLRDGLELPASKPAASAPAVAAAFIGSHSSPQAQAATGSDVEPPEASDVTASPPFTPAPCPASAPSMPEPARTARATGPDRTDTDREARADQGQPAVRTFQRLFVRMGDEMLELVLDAQPEDQAQLYVRQRGHLIAVQANTLTLVGFRPAGDA
jgi:ParB family chromosome partitioning protein